jgi:hypothetical protein
MKEEHRLRVLENWVLRKLFELQNNEVKMDWRRLYN